MRFTPRIRPIAAVGLAGVLAALTACSADKGAVFAPSSTIIQLSAPRTVLAVRDSTVILVTVRLTDGTPVADGTLVSVGAARGSLNQQAVRTQNGQATVTYQAGSQLGLDTITASASRTQTQLSVRIASATIASVTLTASPETLPRDGGRLTITALAIDANGNGVAGAAVTFTATAGTLGNSPVVTDDSGKAVTTLEARQTTTVTATIDGGPSGEIEIIRRGRLSVSMSHEPKKPEIGEAVTFEISATEGGSEASGTLKVRYGNGERYEQPFTGSATTSQTYQAARTFTVTVTIITAAGDTERRTHSVTVVAPPPPPPPTPTPSPSPDPDPSPSPSPTPGDNDEMDLSKVTWLHHNVSAWPQTSRITTFSHGDPPICIDHTQSGRWPTIVVGGNVIEGNAWVFAKVDGRWYAATYEWLRPGQVCKGIDRDNIGPHVKKSPLDKWKPKSGETVGFMVSTPARSGPKGKKQERSNVIVVTWP
ncbi:MAG: Ig-like domain-containing protein [Vicinamibacterales bacterium]|nr:Ig-like domain-containing protein [Vicinamibacterales bacterium]|tara:strand:+ start:688 stop:2127 length:1440 start_codon:yes stop_codon:yes gene_type:complete